MSASDEKQIEEEFYYTPGSIMQLIATHPNEDRMIRAVELLNQRLKEIEKSRGRKIDGSALDE